LICTLLSCMCCMPTTNSLCRQEIHLNMPPKVKQVIDLNALDPEQLSMLKEQFQEELNGLMRSTVALQKAAGEFGASGQAVEALQEQEEGW
jgi:hypothetical protein